MERPIFQPPGTPVEELDTPALVVDLDVMGSNIQIFHSSFRQSRAEIRPYVAVHQCPQIAYFQIEAGNTPGDGGIAVATLGEAEVFTEAGFRNVLIASQIVTRSKIERLCALARSNAISVAVGLGSQRRCPFPSRCGFRDRSRHPCGTGRGFGPLRRRAGC